MEVNKEQSGKFFFIIIAIIVGRGLFKQINFETFEVKNIGITIIYLITFVLSIYVLLKGAKKSE